MKKYDAVVAGYFCVDLVPGFPESGEEASLADLLHPGRLTEIDGLDFLPGGVVGNTGLAMKKFGNNVRLNGLIGDDLLGKMVYSWFEKEDLSAGLQSTGKAGTAFSIVLAPPGIDRIFLESAGCNRIFGSRFIDFKAAFQSRLFHFGYPPLLREFYINQGDELLSAFAAIQQAGVVTSLDFSLPDRKSESGKQPWPAIMKRVLPYVDIFVPSLEEAMQIMMPAPYEALLSSSGDSDIIDLIATDLIREMGKRIMACGVKILLIKAGHRGIYLLSGDVSSLNRERGLNLSAKDWNHREMWCNAYAAEPAKIKNATGAGDTAVAAFLTAVLAGNDPETAVEYAALAGRNSLYCRNIYEEIEGWTGMKDELVSSPARFIHFDEKLI